MHHAAPFEKHGGNLPQECPVVLVLPASACWQRQSYLCEDFTPFWLTPGPTGCRV